MKDEESKNQILDILERDVIRHIQRLMKAGGQEITEEQAKNVMGHLAKKMLLESIK